MSHHDPVREVRLQKLQELREANHDPYAAESWPTTHLPAEIHANYEALENQDVSCAGRIVAIRVMGKAAFADIWRDGDKIQIYVKRDDVGDELWHVFKETDIGDIVGVKGFVFKTRTGETSIHVKDLRVLAKCLHTLPIGKEKEGERWYGLSDVEERYRHRYLDLIANPDSREIFLKRSAILSTTRRFLDERGFIEVETPVLQTEAGGAAARPFLTFHNALEIELKLRISLELHLKRLIVGGFDKVYEIGRVFRNEGISTRHNPEFTLLELYQAYAQMEDIQALVEELCRELARTVFGSETLEVQGQKIDFGKPWRRIDLLDAIEQYAGVKPSAFETLESAKRAMEEKGLPTEKEDDVGGIIEKFLERFVEPHLQEPTFVENYPIETSPLAKKHPTRPGLTRRFEGYIRGREVCNAFSELNDPLDQRERMERQAALLAKGNLEANPLDEDFLYALEIGMPPTAGLGIGMDRLVMTLTGAESIRDVILFPTLRPERKED
ncbi:MAG: lysine--tRNA ligase [Fimbriimonadales bacterium]|nr:MAG: lysine--tRNA ligase [Fimbriimonadales bacterium]